MTRSKTTQKQLAAFLSKTWSILQNPLCNSMIGWDSTGTMIELRDEITFEQNILASQFKHKNIKSFIRQLNMYGFKKAKRRVSENSFYHPHFLRDSYEQIRHVKRHNSRQEAVSQNAWSLQQNIQCNQKKTVVEIETENTILRETGVSGQKLKLLPLPSLQQFSLEEIMPSYQGNLWDGTDEHIYHDENSFMESLFQV